MSSPTLLTGRYFLSIQNGSLCLDFDTDQPELWLENKFVKVRLLPYSEDDSPQLSLPFLYGFDLAEMALEYKRLFTATLKALDRFVSEKQSIAIFCLSYGDSALELVNDCPGLAFLIASRSFYQFGDDRKDGSCLSPEEKRMAILSSNDYPGTKSVAKIFRKIPAAECSWEFFHDLKALLSLTDRRIMKVLCHVPRVNYLLVKILSMQDLRPCLEISFFEEMVCMSRDDRRVRYFKEIFELKDAIRDAIENGIKIAPLRKVADLSGLHEDVIDWLRNRHSFERLKGCQLSEPPFPGLDLREGTLAPFLVRPLKSGIDLWHEGQLMHHCIAGYADSIIRSQGKQYAYHLELANAEHATLLICKMDGLWQIEDIRGPCNGDVSEQMMVFAMQWLERRIQPLE